MQVVQLSAFFCRMFFVLITLISRRFSSAMLTAVYLATCESSSSTLNERSFGVGAIGFLSLLFLEASSFLDMNFFSCKLAFFIELIFKLILPLQCIWFLSLKTPIRYAIDVNASSQPDWIVDFMMRHCTSVQFIDILHSGALSFHRFQWLHSDCALSRRFEITSDSSVSETHSCWEAKKPN